MYIENVTLFNINTLFDITAYSLEQTDMAGKAFERNLAEIYNQMSVTFNIKTLSFMEYFHMKYMLQEGSMEPLETTLSMPYINSAYSEIASSVRQLKRILTPEDFKNIIPPACFSGSSIVTLSGKDLFMIFKSDPMREFFVKVIPEDKLYDEDHKFNRPVIDDMFKDGVIRNDDIEQMFINTFLTNFYTSMISNHEYVDILSDFSLQRFYVDDTIQLISVNNAKATSPTFTDDLNRIRDNINVPFDSVKLTFSLYTDFATFINVYNQLPKRCFVAIETLRIPHSLLQGTFAINGMPEEVNTALEALRTSINDSYGVKGKEIVYASLVPGNSGIHYIIQISLRDVNLYIDRLRWSDYGMKTKTVYENMLAFSKTIFGIMVQD